mmetsp:Transcript_41310/g.131401  ORF Transcript_41310/g.131401 Transcript_41310/m.131401 type:complete len:139 (+) Transcript_41310:112-528(+)
MQMQLNLPKHSGRPELLLSEPHDALQRSSAHHHGFCRWMRDHPMYPMWALPTTASLPGATPAPPPEMVRPPAQTLLHMELATERGGKGPRDRISSSTRFAFSLNCIGSISWCGLSTHTSHRPPRHTSASLLFLRVGIE